MLKFLHRIRQWFGRKPPAADLTVVEYEAVSLIAYKGRAAYERAREQAEYCLSRGSEQAAGSGQMSLLRSHDVQGDEYRKAKEQPR